MVDLLIDGGTVVTMNEQRDILEDGSVAIDGDSVVAVGPSDKISADYDADRILDANEHAILPGFISSHAHVSDVVVRGMDADRVLHDWLLNVNYPCFRAMEPADHEVASALYCQEVLQSGITTFVENAIGPGSGFDRDSVEVKLDTYDAAGIRCVFADSFSDAERSGEMERFFDSVMRREPDVNHGDRVYQSTVDALEKVETLIEDRHKSADERISIWPGPSVVWNVTPEGLAGSYELAEKYDVMTTLHVSETFHEETGHLSTVEYLDDAGYLGERALIGHCVHFDDRDVRVLAQSDTKVAHNVMTNLWMGSGIAPVPDMIRAGVTVGLGTDNASASDSVNMVNDLRFAAMVHKGHRQDAGALTAEKALEMATIDGAKAIGREDDLGSVEPGKLADIILVDLDRPHLRPIPNVVNAIVYRFQGSEIDTVVCNGEVVIEDRVVEPIERTFPDLKERSRKTFERVSERAGFEEIRNRPWTSISGRRGR